MDNLSFLEKTPRITKVQVIGMPLDLGKDNIGTDSAPAVLREQGLVKALKHIGLSVADLGDISCPTRAEAEIGDVRVKYLAPITSALKPLAEQVEKSIRAGVAPIVLGGDHSLAVGTISGASAALSGDMGVIWIDAHGDINTDATSLSGNIHGMPLAAVLGMGNTDLVNLHQEGQKVKPQNVVYVGLKDLDQAEIDIIREQGITAFTILDIERHGLNQVFEAIEKLQKRVSKIWISLDVDSIDAEYAPGTPMKNTGGLTYREINSITQYIGKACSIAGFEVVEFAPDRDVDNKTAQLIIELSARLLGTDYSWYTGYMAEEEKKQERRGAAALIDAVHN